jgi:ParB family chromosome partitioning protein
MAVKKGLGKGINSLISEDAYNFEEETKKSEQEPVKEVIKEVVKEVPVPEQVFLKLRDIEPNRHQPRSDFNEDSLKELTESIKQYGIVQPLIVRKKGKHYEIIAGERRWRAAKEAGLKEVPVVIKEYTEQEMTEVSLIENIQRENLNPVEEALGYKRLVVEFHLKQEEVAEKVSKSRAAVANSMRLLKLDDEVLNLLAAGQISTGHAKVLLELTESEQQKDVAEMIVEKNLSVRETERLVKTLLNPAPEKKEVELTNKELYKQLQERLAARMGTKVSINRKSEDQGKIEIEYYSREELERIMETIGM